MSRHFDGSLFSDTRPRNAWKGYAPRKPRSPRPAAGLLPRYTDDTGVWVLLGLRALSLGGTWSNIGGSLEPDEAPLAGAAREFTEEVGLPVTALGPAGIAAAVSCGTESTPYTLFVVDVTVCIDDAVLGWENDDLCWWRVEDVAGLRLHAGFRRAWEVLGC